MKKIIAVFIIQIIVYQLYSQPFLIPYRLGNKWGYCDTLGKIKIAPQFDEVEFFVQAENGKNPFTAAIVTKNKLRYVIDTLGNLLISVGYEVISCETQDSSLFFQVYDNYEFKGLYINNLLVVPAKFYRFDYKELGFIIATNRDNKEAIYNTKGVNILNFFCDRIYIEPAGYIKFVINEKEGVANMNGKIIAPAIYKNIYSEESNCIKAELDSLVKIYSIAENREIKIEATTFEILGNNLIKVKKNKRYGVVNFNGDVIIPFVYNKIQQVKNKNFLVNKKGFVGLLSPFGKEIIPTEYDQIFFSTFNSTLKYYVWNAYKCYKAVHFIDSVNVVEKFRFEDFVEADFVEWRDKIYAIDSLYNEDDSDSSILKYYKLDTPFLDSILLKDEPTATLSEINKKVKLYSDTMDYLKKIHNLDAISDLSYDSIFRFTVIKNKRYGIIDDSLKIYLHQKQYKISDVAFNSQLSWIFYKYKSKALFVVEEKGKFGLINEFEKIVLPLEFSSIVYQNDLNGFVLTKNNKVGVFTITTIYNPIPLKYKIISFAKALTINKIWSFNVYSTENLLGKSGYIGENGIEYFKD